METRLTRSHPGKLLLQEFLEPMGISQTRLALALGVPPRRVNEIVNGKRGISVDTALRLARFFDMTAEFWLNLQRHYELEEARDKLTEKIKREVRPLSELTA